MPDRPHRCKLPPRRWRRQWRRPWSCRQRPCRSGRARLRASVVGKNQPEGSRGGDAELGKVAERLPTARRIVERLPDDRERAVLEHALAREGNRERGRIAAVAEFV